jgi:NAD(P)-dependent dehydrogenase (short-subunit alcohol dehydrogenase family)
VSASSEPVAVITGAGSGIGRAVAQRLSQRGWRVALAGRREAALHETAASCPGGPDACLTQATDVAIAADVDALFAAVGQRWRRIDLLFNNAGTFGRSARLDEMAIDAWREVIDANLTGSFLCARAAFAVMRAQDPAGGRIINNGSVSAHVPRPHSAAYTASKHAITGLTRAIALDGRPFGIACGQIDIGNAATELSAGIAAGTLQADGSRRAEPMMEVAQAADAVVHMASLPPGANVLSMTVMATAMPLVGRG